MTTQITDLQAHWPPIAPVFLIRNDEEYDAAIARLNALLDEVGTDEKHALYSLLDTLGTLIHTYELEHQSISNVAGPRVLQHLMEEHELTTAEIPEIGAADGVEKYLAGKAELSVAQVRALARRFHVSTSAFI
jgi:HTH-type transcriptional regulator/antitoxin HigA